MKLPRFKVSNDFYNPTHLILEFSQVMIKPAKRRSRRMYLDLTKRSGVWRHFKPWNRLEMSGPQAKELHSFPKKQDNYLLVTENVCITPSLEETEQGFRKMKGRSFQSSHSNFEIVFYISKTEWGLLFLSFLKICFYELLLSSHFHAPFILLTLRMVAYHKQKVSRV